MKKTGQINLAYAGGGDVTGIPMKGQMPIYANNEFNRKWLLNGEGNKTMYNHKTNKEIENNNNRSFFRKGNDFIGNNNDDNINRTFYRRQKSFEDFNRNLTMKSNNPNSIHSPQNYQQTIKEKIAI